MAESSARRQERLKKNMIKLIASDIDGTLIPDSTPDLYPEMVEEIKKLTDRGILFCGASGRQLASIRRVFREVEDQICYIAENGAHVYYKGKDLALTAMKPEYARQIVEQLRSLGSEYEFTVSTPHGSLLETKNRLFLDMMKYGYHNIFRQVEDVLADEEVILKIAVYHRGSIRQLGEELLIPQWGGLVKTCVAGEEWVDFMDASVDKGNALRTLQQVFGVAKEETMAFGDNTNDIGLMQAAGFSYAVENARPEVKAAARFTCPSYLEKGVWKTIMERCGKES